MKRSQQNNGPQEPDFFALDENRLDYEWVNQPRLYYQYANQLADAKDSYERAKAAQELVAAEMDHRIRSAPEQYGVSKITEGVVEKTILMQQPYLNAQRHTLEAKHNMDVAQVAVITLDHRKKALEGLVQLRLANYFSEPRVKGDTGQEISKRMVDDTFTKKRVKQ